MFSKSFLLGAATGAAAMYLLDPRSGQERREAAEARAREVAKRPEVQRAAGTVIDVTRPIHDRGPDSDPTLVDKVSSEVLGRSEFSDLELNLAAHDGTITVRGVIDDLEVKQQLVTAIAQVGGVDAVEDLSHRRGEPAPNLS